MSETDGAAIEVEAVGAARVVRLARPDRRNALSRAGALALAQAIEEAAADESVRGIVLAARGPVFAAGGDLVEFASWLDKKGAAEEVLAMGRRLREIERAPVPVAAAVEGDVFGGGCELLLLCDAVFVAPAAALQFRHAQMGLAPAWGASSRLPERVGPLHAARLLLTAERIDGREAARIGLATAAVADPLREAFDLIERAAKLDRDAVAAQKRSLFAARAAARDAADDREADIFRSLWGAPPHRAAMLAFAERRARGSGTDRA